MKKTKEIKQENEILKITSEKDAQEFKSIASGRKFCKQGERIIDICKEEIERYEFNHTAGLLAKLFKGHKYRKSKKCLMLECRTTSIIRAFAVQYINKCEEEGKAIVKEEMVKNIKETINKKVEEYYAK